MFLLREFFKFFVFSRRIRVGFVLDVFPMPYYGRIMASARLRAYDVINIFRKDKDYFLELYKPWKKYDLVIFQKKFDEKALKLAEKFKKKGAKIILDINVNYYDKLVLKHDDQKFKQINDFTELTDGIIASSDYIENFVKKIFPEKIIVCIPELITDNFFKIKKILKSNGKLSLLFQGYAVKAKEILQIEKILLKLRKKYNFDLVLICEKNPNLRIPGIKIQYLKYKQKKIPDLMLKGDIFIAPRDMDNPYNLGHSFNKIGYPMSVGVPVVASCVPSYQNSPALLCENATEWYSSLSSLLQNSHEREILSEKGIDYCRKKFSSSVIKEKYLSFFQIVNQT